MKKLGFGLLGIALLAIAWATFADKFSFRTEAQRSTPLRYEYAVINGPYQPYPPDGPSVISSAVTICYLQMTGCQNEEAKAEVNLSKFLQDERLENAGNARSLAASRAVNVAYSKAIAKLGGEGWEMVGSPDLEFDLYYTNSQGIPTVAPSQQADRKPIWFRRVRQ